MKSRRKGFTLIEILVVVAVFSVTSLVATNIFLLATQASRRSAIQQKLQGDIRFALEAIAREVRFGSVDYECYAPNPSCDPEDSSIIDLLATGGKTALLALRDTQGDKIRYKVMENAGEDKLHVCFVDVGKDELTKCDVKAAWEVVTPEGVQILSGDFFITPYQNPFRLKDPVPPTGSPYLADSQPRVTLVLRSQQVSDELVPEDISAQTTVVSRYYAR